MKNNKRNIFKLLIEKFYSIFQDKKTRRITGLLFLLFSIFLLASFISYLFNGQIDQDKLENFSNEIKNIGGNLGNMLAHKFIFHWFGISSFILPFTLFFIGFKLFFERYIFSNSKFIYSSIFFVLWVSILFGFITKPSILSGVFGIEMNKLFNEWLGKIMTENPPPLKNGRSVKLKFVSQVSVSPPKFNIFSNHPDAINDQYKKYLSNKLKRNFQLEGLPIKVRFKKTNNPYE